MDYVETKATAYDELNARDVQRLVYFMLLDR